MSQLDEIQSVQKSLEETLIKKIDELHAQLQVAGPAKETVAKVAEEFRTFREIVFNILGLLRRQIAECIKSADAVDAWQRRKARRVCRFTGIAETENENCTMAIIGILRSKMALKDVTETSIRSCHRLGASRKDHNRPVLVRFSDRNLKSVVWNAKTSLKGSSVAVKEFLTKYRQSIFNKARLHAGRHYNSQNT